MKRVLKTTSIIVWTLALVLWSASAFAELKEVGVLESFDGDFLLKHKGFWGETPQVGMTLYHGDKVLTREGTCQVRFEDGSLLDIAPHSSVRIAETYIKRGLKLVRQRDVRLFIGKVRYASGSADALRTQLVAPTAVAALRGTDVEFGADGILATLHMLDGESDVAGNIARVDSVPGATADQAGANPEYKAADTAGKVRREYLKAVQSLVQSVRGGEREILLAAADPVLVSQIVAQSGDGGAAANAHKVLLLAALYVVADMNALIEENKALLDNPDDRTADRAKETLEEAAEAKQNAVRTLQRARETVKQVNEIVREALSGGPEAARAVLQDLKPVIAKMMKDQKQVNQAALGDKLIINVKTAGVDEALDAYEERENERRAEEDARERAGDFQTFDVGGAAALLIDDAIETNGENLEGTPVDEAIDDLEDEMGELETTVAGEADRFPDLFGVRMPPAETDNDRDGDGVPDDRDSAPSDPRVTVEKGYAD